MFANIIKGPHARCTTHRFIHARHKSHSVNSSIDDVLSKPSWSISSLLPDAKTPAEQSDITPAQLHKLLRLSALPLPASKSEEDKMLNTLRSQLHFVNEVQKVDTRGVEPLRSIRDETAEALKEDEITIESLQDAFAKEKVVGKHYRRIRRQPSDMDEKPSAEDWDVLGQAERKINGYFVVETVPKDTNQN